MKTAEGFTLVRNGQLIDGTGAPAVRDAAVVIRDGRVCYAGAVAQAPSVPRDVRRLDARGGTIMPGLGRF
jgi:imidazolonepropionase-like amidohydrolase